MSKNASLALITLSVGLTVLGLPCCLGWINWFAIPISLTCLLVGVVGLATDKEPGTDRPRDGSIHTAAIVVGALMLGLGVLRWVLGAGIL